MATVVAIFQPPPPKLNPVHYLPSPPCGWLQEDRILVGAVQQFGENWVLVAFSINKYPILRGRMRYADYDALVFVFS